MSTRFSRAVRVAAIGALLATIVPAVANAAVPEPWGWVTARKPTTANYTPATKDQGNSLGGTNTVKRLFVGRYDVTLGGLDATQYCDGTDGCLGTAVATAMSSTQRWCVVGDIESSLPVTIFVVCRDRAGNYADSAFSVNFLAPRRNFDTIAYLYADQQSNSGYYPADGYNYNSENTSTTPSKNYVQRLGVGYYFVYLKNTHAGEQGNLQVNGTLGTCKIEDRYQKNDVGDTYGGVYVRCRDLAGNPADNTFFLNHTYGLGLAGPGGRPTAYVFADQSHAASYHPQAPFAYLSSGQTSTITRSSTGVYKVKLPGMSVGGSAQVSAFGTGKSSCQLASIAGKTAPQTIGVRCYSAKGALVDSQFYLTFTR